MVSNFCIFFTTLVIYTSWCSISVQGNGSMMKVGGHSGVPHEGWIKDDALDDHCSQRSSFDDCDEDDTEDITFLLYTRGSKGSTTLRAGDLKQLKKSGYKPENNLKILVHGFWGNRDKEFPSRMKDAYLESENEEFNVIVVEWQKGASHVRYYKAVQCTKTVAKKISKMIKFLIKSEYTTYDKIHIIGHSLGAQITGMTGHILDGKIGRLTGLDPARPCFRKNDTKDDNRIHFKHGKFIDVIHTDGEIGEDYAPSLIDQLGHVDFYPNGGVKYQPGCEEQKKPDKYKCSHSRAHQYFVESIKSQDFQGRECSNWRDFKGGKCDDNEILTMGEHVPVIKIQEKLRNGNIGGVGGASKGTKYFLRTAGDEPFALGERGARSDN